MPVNVADRRIAVGVLLPGLLLVTALSCISLGDEKDGAADAGDPKDPKKSHQLQQQKLVLQLRRMDKPLLTPEIIADYQKNARAYRNLLTNGVNARNPKELETLRVGLRYKILSMSDSAVQGNPVDLETSVQSFQRDIRRAGSVINNVQTRTLFRELLCKEAMPLIRQLLENNFISRSIALELLQDLEVVPPGPNNRMVMFAGVSQVLLEVLQDPDQPDGIKVRAANTITNYLQKADAIPQIQTALAKGIASELEREFTDDAYQIVLLAALEEVTAPRELVAPNTAVVLCIAARLMRDPKRDIQVRCRAARVMGRAGYDSQTNIDVLAWATADLTVETSALFNRAPNKKHPKWVYCAFYLYTAFHHWDRGEATGRAPALPKGFLNRAPKSAAVRDAYKAAVPVISQMFVSKTGVPVKLIGVLLQWTGKNKPPNLKFDPSCPPLTDAGNGNQAPPTNG